MRISVTVIDCPDFPHIPCSPHLSSFGAVVAPDRLLAVATFAAADLISRLTVPEKVPRLMMGNPTIPLSWDAGLLLVE